MARCWCQKRSDNVILLLLRHTHAYIKPIILSPLAKPITSDPSHPSCAACSSHPKLNSVFRKFCLSSMCHTYMHTRAHTHKHTSSTLCFIRLYSSSSRSSSPAGCHGNTSSCLEYVRECVHVCVHGRRGWSDYLSESTVCMCNSVNTQ